MRDVQGPSLLGPKAVHAYRILVVDDNVDAAEVLAETLEMLGHKAAVAHDAHHALEVQVFFKPDVCVLDVGLPGMDGYELGDRLRIAAPKRLPLIACTAYAEEALREKSRARGFSAHLVKPVILGGLIEALGQLEPAQ